MRKIKITDHEADQRLDRFLRKYLTRSSLGNIQKLIRKKVVRINDRRAEAAQVLRCGDVLTLRLSSETLETLQDSSAQKEEAQVQSHPLSIIFEDEELLVVHKPVGLLTHPAAAKQEDSLTTRVTSYLASYTSSIFTPACVNRLDRNTEGLVMFGKTPTMLRELNQAMRERRIHKFYYAVVEGAVPAPGAVRAYQKKDARSNRSVLVSAQASGARFVHTRYWPVEQKGGYTLCEVELCTGRTHQIRLACAHMGHPLVGDCKYGASPHKGFPYLLQARRITMDGREFIDTHGDLLRAWRHLS
ncbi:RluA family pseudouridine synthase [Chitinivibrio alkaliphilus]|uniref:Pseudouridine synthase, RsuA/RluD family n=1 Tax=Chitinivibrio alkaliphilus ACht1 TaxID=1313304 RepID=U7D8D6_9BACT|nr:RluA family pseudouridine synthase [Chitinivibrio alkaliphilus]ERP32213.1 Pseudouridine synthase, RsuA/RluD family [Chitinivibrio alkaliphilus ACht1]